MPSKQYDRALEQMRQHHLTRKTFSGNGVLKHLGTLLAFSADLGATSGLDFGCGKGDQYGHALPEVYGVGGFKFTSLEDALGYEPFKYDPGVFEFENLPPEGAMFDLVWCVDVLECVPEGDMDWVIAQMIGYARKGIFVTVATYPSKKTLPNGRNAHITVKPSEWWHAHFSLVREARPDLKIKLLVA